MKQKQEITFFVSSRLMSFLSFILSYPFSSVASFLPSFLGCLFPNMVCVLPSFISSFLLPLLVIYLILWWTLINPPYLPCVAHKPPWILCIKHPLPLAPPGCSRACAWQAKWSSDTHGGGWISRTPIANRSWGSVETWNERNVMERWRLWRLVGSQTLTPKEMRS